MNYEYSFVVLLLLLLFIVYCLKLNICMHIDVVNASNVSFALRLIDSSAVVNKRFRLAMFMK